MIVWKEHFETVKSFVQDFCKKNIPDILGDSLLKEYFSLNPSFDSLPMLHSPQPFGSAMQARSQNISNRIRERHKKKFSDGSKVHNAWQAPPQFVFDDSTTFPPLEPSPTRSEFTILSHTIQNITSNITTYCPRPCTLHSQYHYIHRRREHHYQSNGLIYGFHGNKSIPTPGIDGISDQTFSISKRKNGQTL